MTTPVVSPGGRVDWQEVAVPEPAPGEVLVRMEAAAVCGSDLHSIFAGGRTEPFWPGGPGHEGVGRVAVSRSARFTEGERVLTAPDAARGHCFAAYQVVPEGFLARVPDDLPPHTAVLAQQLGTVIFALKKFWRGPGGRTAAVIGAGPAGLAFVGAIKRLGFEWVGSLEPRPYRRDAARRMGAALSFAPDPELAVDQFLDATDGRGADLVVEASGQDDGRILTAALLARDGHIGFFGLPAGSHPVPLPFSVLFSKRAELASSVGAQFEPDLASFQQALAWIAEEPAYWGQLVTHRLPLSALAEALSLAEHPDGPILKVVLEMSMAGTTA